MEKYISHNKRIEIVYKWLTENKEANTDPQPPVEEIEIIKVEYPPEDIERKSRAKTKKNRRAKGKNKKL